MTNIVCTMGFLRTLRLNGQSISKSICSRRFTSIKDQSPLGAFSVDRSGLAKQQEIIDIDTIEGSIKEKATPLARDLHSYIGWRGPISFHDFMAQALNHTLHGYYQSKMEKIGELGDFVTAPELGQLFGEMIGIWCIMTWQAMGSPKKVNIIELGPGKGTLMKDILKVIQKSPLMRNAFDIQFVELSQSLRLEQLKALTSNNSSDDAPTIIKDGEKFPLNESVMLSWHSVLATVPNDAPSIIIGQEFLDAFPVHQFVFSNGSWKEKLVDIDTDPATPYHFRVVLSPGPTPAVKTLITTENENVKKLILPKANNGTKKVKSDYSYGVRAQKAGAEKISSSDSSNNSTMSHITQGPREGDGLEICPLAISTVEGIAQRVVSTGGAALFIDYGEDFTQEDTLRGFYKHTQKDVLSELGRVDITADVDFSLCRKSALRHGAKVLPLQTQGNFLVNMGIIQRVEQLIDADHVTEEEANMLFESMKKLVDPNEMGKKFKVLSIVHPSLEKSVVGFPPTSSSQSP